jgi:hypothetical protein
MTTVVAWTLVQHSGVETGHDEFAHGTEVRRIINRTEYNLVKKVGGLLFESYGAAIVASDEENYPHGHAGWLPRVPGLFSADTIDGSRIYLPGRQDVRTQA